MSIATVNGPIPPGTGVYSINSLTLLISISPVITLLPGSRLNPTSKIIPLGFTAFMRRGWPVAETMISALRAASWTSYLLDLSKILTSTPRFRSIMAAGRPTRRLFPITMAFLPLRSTPNSSQIWRIAWEVQGRMGACSPNCSTISRLFEWRQSISLLMSILSRITLES